ncbi:hypothetical protein SELMODRAFT_420606 [Selaginella moellendorffii]|uniref:Uncharacterized protein n=1 Tax=Selaginella moellendorffii TaxID=88036 RepID=D8SCI7_SELML|nr:hypothetical protein SELMODRAFT_420606 [Selaginella moellendorffii]
MLKPLSIRGVKSCTEDCQGHLELIRNTIPRHVEADDPKTLIQKELVPLLEHDNAKYPMTDKSGKPPPVAGELGRTRVEGGCAGNRRGNHPRESLSRYYTVVRDALADDMTYFPQKSGYERASLASTAERLAAAQYEFEAVRKLIDGHTKKALKLEQKISVLAGYKIEAAFREAESLGTELQCYRSVHQQEELIAPRGIEAFQEEVKRQRDKESVLQMRYERI